MSKARLVKKGELLFKEGQPSSTLYLVKSGRISVYTEKSKKNIELYIASTGQVLGEEAIFGAKKYGASAIVKNDSQILEFPVQVMQAQLGTVNQAIQVLLNSLVEKVKNFKTEIRNYKLENDTTPCPSDLTAYIYGTVYHTARYIGEQKAENDIKVNYQQMRKYAQRVFNLSPVRCENAIFSLVKMDLAEIEMVKDPDDPDGEEIIGFIHFKNLPLLEKFFEYYQSNFFKGVNPHFFKPDQKDLKMVDALLKVSEKGKEDRNGVVWINFKEAMDELKKYLGKSFEPDKFNLLEQKGLYVNRKSDDSGGFLNFYKDEFLETQEFWKLLRIIEQWNEDGEVNLAAEEEVSPEEDFSKCPNCTTETTPTQKFCTECGLNLLEARGQEAA